MMSGSGVSSRTRAEAGTWGLKAARNGFAGFAPTMSGISFGGFVAVGTLRRFRFRPNESRRPCGPAGGHAQCPAVEHKRDHGKGDATDNDRSGFELGTNER